MSNLEIWKELFIEGYKIKVSNLGRIKTLDRIKTNCNGVDKFVKGKIKYLELMNTGYYGCL